MKTKSFKSFKEAKDFVSTLLESYAVVLDQHLISHDAAIEMKAMEEIDSSCKEFGCDWTYFIGIRTRGVEGCTNKDGVITRILELHDKCVCAIQVNSTGSEVTVSYKQAKLNF